MKKINFTYNRQKDIWCLLNKGKSSNNSQSATKVYQELVSRYGDTPTDEETSEFIDKYIIDKEIDILGLIEKFEQDWSGIEERFHKIAESVFDKILPENITAYLTINTRCPYSIEGNYFFVSISNTSALRTIMHELWHFYTWQKFGSDIEDSIGKQKYNDIKEGLTVLLNIECKDLLPEGVIDIGYPQHKELRKEIVSLWNKNKSVDEILEGTPNVHTSLDTHILPN